MVPAPLFPTNRSLLNVPKWLGAIAKPHGALSDGSLKLMIRLPSVSNWSTWPTGCTPIEQEANKSPSRAVILYGVRPVGRVGSENPPVVVTGLKLESKTSIDPLLLAA